MRGTDSGRKIELHFCPDCGSTVFWHAEFVPHLVGAALGAFADPSMPSPTLSLWETTRHPWVTFDHELDRFGRLNIDEMQDSMRAPWVAGDFGAIAREIGAPAAEAFVARMALEPGERVLDIACGTGNVTIPLARRGAMVTGLDMMPHLLEEARARAAREGLPIRFDEGFAETLPYPDGSFDVLVSMFGIMFSPLPATVASEMARVLRPGGRLALANWTASGFTGKMSAVAHRYLPPPSPGSISPFLWGEEAAVRDRLKPGFDAVETQVVAARWEIQRSAAGSAEFFAENSGPIQLAIGRLDAPKQAALLHDLERLWIDNNLATNGKNHTLISNEYLEALATRR
jgi:2-polyprenyl-3-methyl-5-hydroxy-6-metoxy-1,4-benzoquinol methylase